MVRHKIVTMPNYIGDETKEDVFSILLEHFSKEIYEDDLRAYFEKTELSAESLLDFLENIYGYKLISVTNNEAKRSLFCTRPYHFKIEINDF